jgi:putative ABC transport system substrate-binding protein
MKRREFITILIAAWWPFTVSAFDAPKVPRIGWLGSYAATNPAYQGFHDGLRELGYIEGKNVIIEARWAEGKFDRLPALARELANLHVDVLLVGGEDGLKAAKEATATIPIVVVTCDPLDKLVASIARPGGKATGVTCISSELTAKRLQILKELMPQLTRVAVLYHSADIAKSTEYTDLIQAASKLNLTLRSIVAGSENEISAAFADMTNDSSEALVILADSFMNFHIKTLANLALKHHLPTIYGFREFADAGGLVSYGASRRHQIKRAASYIDKILKGSDPGDLPIELPTKFEFIINLHTAKALNVTIPPSMQILADEVIE